FTRVGPELTASVTAAQSSASGIRTVSGDPTTAWSCSVCAADPRATRTAPSAGTSTLESVKTDCTTPLRSRRGVAGGNGPRTTIVVICAEALRSIDETVSRPTIVPFDSNGARLYSPPGFGAVTT